MNKLLTIETDPVDSMTWCQVSGDDFDGVETFGVTPDGKLYDVDGYPLTPGDCYEISARNAIGDAWKVDKFPIARVTEKGRAEIIDALDRLTTLDLDDLTPANIDVWCEEAERHAEGDGTAYIEIEARYSRKRHTELVDIDGVIIEWVQA